MFHTIEVIKNFLKHILPPPVNAFNREMNVLRQSMQEVMATQQTLSQCLLRLEQQMTELDKKLTQQTQELDKKLAQLDKKLAQQAQELGKRIFAEEKKQYDILEKIRRQVIPVKRDYDYYLNLPPEKYEGELWVWYKNRTGENLNLNSPRSFNEKIQWLKLYDSTPLKTRLADKYLVRDWVKEKIGEEHLIPLLGVWDSFDEIDFDKLPDQFVLKANHGWGWNIIVKDKSEFDMESARTKFDTWLKTNFAFRGFELQYMNIPPKIIAEKYMEDMGLLYDYKLMCFGGEVKFIWVWTNNKNRSNTSENGARVTIFTKDWERMPVGPLRFVPAEYDIPRPKNLEQMISFAEILSEGFALVRVDFYEVSGQIYFGEMTFTPGAGATRFVPTEFEYRMGSWIQLPKKSPIPERLF